jgi:hypothetical protein
LAQQAWQATIGLATDHQNNGRLGAAGACKLATLALRKSCEGQQGLDRMQEVSE